MELLRATTTDAPRVLAGTIQELASDLYTELMNSGYALIQEDVAQAILRAVLRYVAWDSLDAQRNTPQDTISLDSKIRLAAHEWMIVEPLARAHCDLMQANRMEASRSLGMEQVGLSVSEALQNLQQQQDLMPQKAFCAPPFAIEIDP